MSLQHDLIYYRRIHGTETAKNQREATLIKAKRAIDRDWKNNIDWDCVRVLESDGTEREQDLKILATATDAQKKVRTRPDDILRLGEVIKWRDTVWLVRTLDPDNKIQYKGYMYQCSTILRWKDDNGVEHEVYGEADDASKYGSGVDAADYIRLPYFTVKVRVPVNTDTLAIGRDKRFLLGHIGQGDLRPFLLTRINDVVYRYVYEDGAQVGTGYIEWTLTEDYDQRQDDQENGVAADTPYPEKPTEGDEEREGWW